MILVLIPKAMTPPTSRATAKPSGLGCRLAVLGTDMRLTRIVAKYSSS